MNIESFEQYKAYEEQGLRTEAKACLHDFVSSFSDASEIEDWVWQYLPLLKENRHCRIRHEIFVELVYPTLKRGYLKQDFVSTLWLGKLVQNIYNNRAIHEELGWVTDYELYLRSYELEPNSQEAKSLLLATIVGHLKYAVHEWPAGMLWGNDGATTEQCVEFAGDLALANKLDAEQVHRAFFADFAEKLSAYAEGHSE